jgi:uncharacterized membrane protein YqjE
MADPLDVIAESYRGIHESTQVMAQVAVQLERGQRLLRILLGLTVGLLGLALASLGVLLWFAFDAHRTLTAQTQALVAVLQRLH